MGATFRDQGQVTGWGQEQRRGSEVFTVRRTELGNKFHAASGEPHIFAGPPPPSSLTLPPSCGVTASSAPSYLTFPPDSPAGDIRGPEPVIMPTQQI